jgi:hypothetical protein
MESFSGRRVAGRLTACVQAARAKELAFNDRNHALKLMRASAESSRADLAESRRGKPAAAGFI